MQHVTHVICILGILFINVSCFFVAYFLEPILLGSDWYQLGMSGNLTFDQWKESFIFWAAWVCVGAALVASFLWYGFAQRVFAANNEKSYGKRGLWGFLFILPMCAVIFSILLVEEAESSLWLAYLFFVVNGLVPYYVATVLFSPVSVKYTPIGAGIRSILPY